MRVQYSNILLPYFHSFLKEQFLPVEPPSEEEMELEAKGLERLEEALRESSND